MQKESIRQLLAAGAGMRVKAMSLETLIELADAARAADVTLTIVGAMSLGSMVQIAHAGKKHVVFDIAD